MWRSNSCPPSEDEADWALPHVVAVFFLDAPCTTIIPRPYAPLNEKRMPSSLSPSGYPPARASKLLCGYPGQPAAYGVA